MTAVQDKLPIYTGNYRIFFEFKTFYYFVGYLRHSQYLENITSDDSMTDESKRIWKEIVVA
jgi:hypothetical protein